MAIVKEIEGYPDYYVSSAGNVWREKSNGTYKMLMPGKDKGGYKLVTLCKDGKTYTKKVHRLVAEAHIPNPDNKPCIDHINGVRTDNRVCNLRWCTQQENCSFPLAKKNLSEANKGKRKGKPRPEGAGRPKKAVVQYTKEGVYVAKYKSLNDAERQTGVGIRHIWRVCNGKRKSAGGYKWTYA